MDQLIIGTGAPAPSDPTKRGKDAGDELFTSAVVALDAETGAYRWHFSQVPGDAWNYEPAVGLMMATLPIDGEDRRVVLSVPKNGFVYLLDAKTGEFISGRNYVPVNWAKGLDDETGRPIFDPAARYWEAADGETTDRPSEQRRCARLDRSGIRPPEERALHPRDDDARTAMSARPVGSTATTIGTAARAIPNGRRSQSSLRGIRSPRARCGGSAMRCP